MITCSLGSVTHGIELAATALQRDCISLDEKCSWAVYSLLSVVLTVVFSLKMG